MKWTLWEYVCMGVLTVVLTAALFLIIGILTRGCQ